jgi:hypothetical protein
MPLPPSNFIVLHQLIPAKYQIENKLSFTEFGRIFTLRHAQNFFEVRSSNDFVVATKAVLLGKFKCGHL